MRSRKGRLLTRVEYLAYRAAVRLVQSASEDAVQRWGTRLGTVARRLLLRRDRLAMRNLRVAFPDRTDDELRRILDECWRHFGREMLAYLWTQRLPLEQIAERCPFVNEHLLREALEAGRGVVVISAHYGGWEIAGLALMAHVKNARTVARPLDNELLERELAAIRAKTGAVVVDKRHAARELMKALSENRVVVILPDQAVLPREGVLVPFLGRPAWTTPAPAKLAARFGSTIVFAFCIPDGPRHRLELVEPIHAEGLADGEKDAVSLTQRINDVISRRIAARPELWLWMHDRWKGTGESEPGDG